MILQYRASFTGTIVLTIACDYIRRSCCDIYRGFVGDVKCNVKETTYMCWCAQYF